MSLLEYACFLKEQSQSYCRPAMCWKTDEAAQRCDKFMWDFEEKVVQYFIAGIKEITAE